MDRLDIVRAFPSPVRDEAARAALALPGRRSSWDAGSYEVRVGGEMLRIPYRVYWEVAEIREAGLEGREKHLLDCILTRHHDGFERERRLQEILTVPEPWVPSFVVQLAGEYVIEILDGIRRNLDLLDAALYGEFLRENPLLRRKTAARVESYWNCYYRRYYSRAQYPGFVVLDFLEQAVAKRPGLV